MTKLVITLSDPEWEQIVEANKQNPDAKWRVIGEQNHVIGEGRITHVPFVNKRQWKPEQKIYVGQAEIGEPVCVGLIRSIVPLPAGAEYAETSENKIVRRS